jgi:membrane associated rhomboid family serine protease
MTPAVKWLIIANAVMFVATLVYPPIIQYLGLSPELVVERQWLWQLVTYLFLHGSAVHILLNMLGIWMFGVELERLWGTRQFVKYYAITGIGAGLTVMAVGLLPLDWAVQTYRGVTIGASGALYGLLVAFAFYYPDRPLLMFFLFPIPAKYFVMIVGAVALFSSLGDRGGNVAHVTHLGGIVVGYVYLRGFKLGRFNLIAELKYRYLRWKINRMRRKFDVHPGGRTDDWDRKIH